MLAERKKKNEYFPVSPLILRPDSRLEFDAFLRHDNSYVLFNAKGRMFTDAKRRELAENNIASIYIDKDALALYRSYVQNNIKELLDDEAIPLDERARAWTNAAASLGKELFEEKLPGAAFEKRYKRFEKLIQNTTSFLQSPNSLKHLARFISKGYDTYHHGISTMVYTVSLMHEYEYDDYKVLACGMGALLHDIGKSGLPEDVISKNPDEMDDDDRAILSLHPMVGARTCSSFNLPVIASNCILFHHERADGKGYPTQALSEDVPLHTKIVALCNRYDNLTRTMPYRKAMAPFVALKTIMDDKGFTDKDILKKFVEMLSQAEIV